MQRYTRQLDQQETRLEAFAKETGQLEAKIETAQAELRRIIGSLVLDARF